MTATAEALPTLAPQPGPQTRFMQTPADICVFGGHAFGGKTYALLLDLARWYQLPEYRGVIFRRTGPEIMQEGGLWDESQNIYPLLGGRSKTSERLWRFPSGAAIAMKSCQYVEDAISYKGLQADVIDFDQLEDFDPKQFWYLISRNRGSSGVRPYIRATANPQPGWLADFLAWWIDPNTGYAIPERDGVIRWMVRLNDQLYWGDSRQEMLDRWPEMDPKELRPLSVTFIRSRAEDNPIGLAKNPGYFATINAMRHVDKERLGRGNWLIRDDDGAEFPAERFLDIYAEKWPDKFLMTQIAIDAAKGVKNGDFSAIIFGGLHNGIIYVDAIVERMPVADLLEQAFELGLHYRPEEVCFEGEQFQDLLVGAFQNFVQTRFKMPWRVGFITHGGIPKPNRIRRLDHWLKDRKLRFRKGSPGVERLLEQARTFGLPKVHDDGPDALEMMLRRMTERAYELYDDGGDSELATGYDGSTSY